MADAATDNKQRRNVAGKNINRSRNTNYIQRKKKPYCPPKSENDFYVSNKSDFQGQLKKILKRFEEGSKEVTIHGLGPATTKAANLALIVEEKLSKTVQLSVNTATVNVQDEWEPLYDDDLPYTDDRSCSALHIQITRVPDFPL